MTTTDDLREAETRLRQRLAELTEVQTSEREKRERARQKVTQVAHSAGDNNSIGSCLDELLIELGLPARPYQITRTVLVTHRQRLGTTSLRSIGPSPYAAYQNLTSVMVETVTRQGITVPVERDYKGCACTLDLTDEMLDLSLGHRDETVERLSVVNERCEMAAWPHQQSDNELSRCATVRANREVMLALAHDDPLVQRCDVESHQYHQPHQHIVYLNGEVTYSIDADWQPEAPSIKVPGWYGTGAQVGQPIPTTNDSIDRVQQCEFDAHPSRAYHVHVLFPGNTVPSYSRDLGYTAEGGLETVLPGVFSQDADRVGGAIPTDDES